MCAKGIKKLTKSTRRLIAKKLNPVIGVLNRREIDEVDEEIDENQRNCGKSPIRTLF